MGLIGKQHDSRHDGSRHDGPITAQLRHAGLKPTRKRVALGRILFAKGDRHVSAEDLHAEAQAAGIRVSLATVYNTLNQFTAAGLLLEVVIDGGRTYFDTNVSDHHHFFVEGEARLIDMKEGLDIGSLPPPPEEDMEITGVDVFVRVRRR
jgi:Fur family iron response transcriptional regulator